MASPSHHNHRGIAVNRFAALCLIFLSLLMIRELWFSSPILAKVTPMSMRTQQTLLPEGPVNHYASNNTSCKHINGADRVMVLMKTGSTELYQKLPTHFVTTFTCVANLRIYSDLPQTFAGSAIHDAVAPVSMLYREQHPDFDLYRRLQKWQQEGQDMSKLLGQTSWNLDKWKFLPMLHDAFEAADENIDWFVVMEADTSISWLNLLLWLQTMDPAKPYYLGAQNLIGTTYFAHGGSGIVVSRAAADLLRTARQEVGREIYDGAWEEVTAVACCGDEIVARAFLAVDVPLTAAWPLIQGETISTVDWTKAHWCAPPITWHHVAPIEVDAHWKFQSEWVEEHGWQTPYLYRDIFTSTIWPHMQVNRTMWNNLSKSRRFVAASMATADDESTDQLEGVEQRSVESETACADACLQAGVGECVQWMFTPGKCHLGKDLRLGQSDETQDEHWTSGWIQERIEDMVASLKGCQIRWSG